MRLWPLFLVSAITLAGPIGPIPVTGSGYFSSDNTFDLQTSLSFSGSSGGDSVSLGEVDNFEAMRGNGGLADCSGLPGCPAVGGAIIDGVFSSIFKFTLGEGSGDVTIYDSGGQILASADLIGYVFTSSLVQDCCTPLDVHGTFDIEPTPEGSTMSLCALGLGICLIVAKLRRGFTARWALDLPVSR